MTPSEILRVRKLRNATDEAVDEETGYYFLSRIIALIYMAPASDPLWAASRPNRLLQATL